MNRALIAILVAVVLFVVQPIATPFAQSSDEVLIKQAVDLEKAKGDVKGAIEIYKKLAQSKDQKTRESAIAHLKRLQPPAPAPAQDSHERLITTERTLGGLGAIRISPDGKRALGFRLTGSEFEGSGLYLRNLENASGRSLFYRPPGFMLAYSAFSPDGRRFAAMMPEATPQPVMAEAIKSGQSLDDLSGPGVLVIGTVEAGGPPLVVEIPKMTAIRFQPGKLLAWSPNGQSVAVAMPLESLHTYELQLFDPSTGGRRSLGLKTTGGIDLMWAPDGRELLAHVASTPGKAGELHVITVANGARRAVPLPGTPESRHRVLRWHSNGEVSVIHHNAAAAPKVDDTYLVSLATGQSRLTCSGFALNLAGAGGLQYATADLCREITLDSARQIVWRHASKRLMVRDLTSGSERTLTSGSGSEEWSGMLSPDDRVEIFVSNRDGRWGLYSAEIAAAPVAAPARLSTFDQLPSFDLRSWTPDGFVASVITNESTILRIDIDPATGARRIDQPERLTQDGPISHTPAVSPDGKRIAFWSQQSRRYGVAVMDSNGANERLLFEAPYEYSGLQPTWRSNTEIVFSVAAGAEPRRVMSVNVATGATSQLTTLPNLPDLQGRPLFVAATNEIFHLDRTFRSILARSLTDSSTRVVASFEGDQEINSYLPSPDGRKIAYSLARRYQSGRACFTTSSEPVATVNQIARPCEIVVLTFETGQRKVMATTPGQNADVPALISWSPDSRFLLFGGGRPQILDTVKETRAPLLLQSLPLDWDRTASWSPDGTFIVFTSRAQRYEWREWKGVR
jgi:Tol biopolymer transport system component